jgi:hypothetical protein
MPSQNKDNIVAELLPAPHPLFAPAYPLYTNLFLTTVSRGVNTELHSFLLTNYDDCYKEATFIMSRQIYLIMTLLHQELTSSILKCAYKVHSALVPGLL